MTDEILEEITSSAGSGAHQADIANTSSPATTPPGTTTAAARSPTVEELRAGGFSYPEIPRITCEQLKQMMDEGKVTPDDFVLVDTEGSNVDSCIRGCKFIAAQYSSGSIILTNNILFSLRALPKDKLIVFYDNGGRDTLAGAVAQALIDLKEGYDPENVKVLWQGFDRWRELNYPYEAILRPSDF
jgi:rhodanese-related sulfurtransferase